MTVIAQSAVTDQLLGPLGMAALALIIIGLFLRGTILSRNTVPREDYEAQVEINRANAEGTKTMTAAFNDLVAAVRSAQKNGGL